MRAGSLPWLTAAAGAGLLFAALAWVPAAQAQAWVPGKEHGSVSLTYQQRQSTKLTDSQGAISSYFGKLIDRTEFLNLDYGLSDRWAFAASLPFGSNRYAGNDPHDPTTQLPFANDQHCIDDGRYHGGWADWSVALRYQWRSKPFLVTPFIAYSQPSHDYSFWAHSALGNQQWAWQAGVHVGNWLPPPWQNMHWQAGYTYSFEQPLDHRRVNHGALSLGLGYSMTPRLDAELRLDHQNSYGDTINLPQDFFNADGSLNPLNLYYHDQLAAARSTNAYLGLNYQLAGHYQLFVEYGRTLSTANSHIWDYRTSIGISRSF